MLTDKQLKLIYSYMGWKVLSLNKEICYPKPRDSNSAWECVQEMEKQGHADEFETFLYTSWCDAKTPQYELVWERNPDNFFNCMGEWLEEREGKK